MLPAPLVHGVPRAISLWDLIISKKRESFDCRLSPPFPAPVTQLSAQPGTKSARKKCTHQKTSKPSISIPCVANRVLAKKIPHFQEKGTRGHPLTAEQQLANRLRSKVRSRVEHVFGVKFQRAGNLIVRTIGIARARVKLGLRNLAYNLERYAMLVRRKQPNLAS